MYKRVHFMSKRDAEKVLDATNAQHRIVISITSPQSTHPESKPAQLHPKMWRDILRFEFHDCDHDHRVKKMNEADRVLFTPAMGRKIFKLLKKYESSDVTDVVVHCEAGISRSAAAAKFISDIYHLPFNHQYSLYNRHIYSTLLKAYGQGDIQLGPQ